MQKLLITGGTGFLGKELAIKLRNDYDLLLAGRNNKQNQIAKNITKCDVMPMDVTSSESVKDILNHFKPNIVIHAAATKFVDLSEKYPMECIDVNIKGSQNIARSCIDSDVDFLIGVSTDKASPPVKNVYGMSKSIMERLFCSVNGRNNTRIACVRYGNVAWSTGSVFPIWKQMHTKNKIIQTTGPEMRRFVFSVKEAVDLILNSMKLRDKVAGKVLSRRMKAAKIKDILEIWIEKFGGTYEAVKGRPGERIDEFLIGKEEIPYTEHLDINGIDHFLLTFNQKVTKPIDNYISSENAENLSSEEILKIISNPPIYEN